MSADDATPLLPRHDHGLSDAQLVDLYETMVLTRLVDRRMQALYRQGRVYGGVYSQEGNEGISCGSAYALADGDALFPMHRGLGARLVHGDALDTILAQLLARVAGPTAGRDSGLHHDVLDRRIFAMISHLGTQLCVANGTALAMRSRGETGVCLSFTGDGATALGDFHEGLNMAAVLKLPVILVVENNLYAYSTPNEGEFACGELAARGPGYGIPAETVDGTDVIAMYLAVRRAVAHARAGNGPSLIEGRALRLRGHSEADAHEYVPKSVLEDGRRREPLARMRATLLARGILDETRDAAIATRAEAALDAALARATALEPPAADTASWGRWSEEGHPSRGRDVPGVPGLAGQPVRAHRKAPGGPAGSAAAKRPARDRARAADGKTAGKAAGDAARFNAPMGDGFTATAAAQAGESTYLQAISRGLRDEMRRDERVFLIGEDIAVMGGAFKITHGFLDEFGADRIVDTPIAESGIIGACIGAALMGLRPVAEMQFADFVTCGFNQIVNNAATWHYRTGTPLPFVVRLPAGGNIGGAPFHSRNPEAWFIHQPGLKVVAPATAEDALALLVAAIRDDNPVLYLEHKYLYRRQKAVLPAGDVVTELGRAALRRPGGDAVIITYGWMVHEAIAAADVLAAAGGGEVGVLDLRTLMPFDGDAVLASVRERHRALVLHEDTLTGGFGGEIAAFIGEHAFEALDAPVMRLGGLDTPVPFAQPLEKAFLPTREKIEPALRQLLAW